MKVNLNANIPERYIERIKKHVEDNVTFKVQNFSTRQNRKYGHLAVVIVPEDYSYFQRNFLDWYLLGIVAGMQIMEEELTKGKIADLKDEIANLKEQNADLEHELGSRAFLETQIH